MTRRTCRLRRRRDRARSRVDQGRMPWSSNATFLVHVPTTATRASAAIYKPMRGERPLWDFEPGLHRREVAAYRPQRACSGCDVVPPTVLRDGPLGEGSLQWFVDADHSRALLHDPRAPARRPRPVAGDRGARPHRQQHRPQERTLPARPAGRPASCGRSTTGCASQRLQAAHRDLGVRRRADRRGPTGRASIHWPLRCRWSWRRCSTTTRWRRCSTGRPGSSSADSPADTSGHRYPWPLV